MKASKYFGCNYSRRTNSDSKPITVTAQSELDDVKLNHLVHKYHLSSKSWTCSCGFKFHNKLHLQVHQREHAVQEKWHYCPLLCGKMFRSLEKLQNHQTGHEDEKRVLRQQIHGGCTQNVTCDQDDWGDSDAGSTEEMNTSSEEENDNEKDSDVHICPICGKICQTVTQLENHNRTHSTVRPTYCRLCDRVFRYERYLLHHLQTHARQSYKCPFCPKAYIHKNDLGTHLNTHAEKTDKVGGIQKYACILCDSEMPGKLLTQHHSSHLYNFKYGMKTFNNPEQKKMKKNKVSLLKVSIPKVPRRKVSVRKIMKTVRKKPFVAVNGECICVGQHCLCYTCYFCQRSFKGTDLMSHLQVHLGQLVQCDDCEEVFSSDDQFFKHRVHLHEVPLN